MSSQQEGRWMVCTECGKENPEQRTYCSACGSTIRDDGSHFSREFYRLIGSLGTARASLELVVTDKTFVVGTLSFDDGPTEAHVEGLLDGSTVLTLELANSTADVDSPEHGPIPVRSIPPLIGRFEGRSFSGNGLTDDQAAVGPFHFVVTRSTSLLAGDQIDQWRQRTEHLAVAVMKAGFIRFLSEIQAERRSKRSQ